ncbi:hypothetical protein LCGC14_2759210, partial [marine sediment metagenome]
TRPSASADDVAKELLADPPDRPVIPLAPPPARGGGEPSVPPTAEPIQAGPAGMVVHRLTRMVRTLEQAWPKVTYVADNTLREPPMRALPNFNRQKMEDLSGTGRLFHVSGEVHHYKGADYILLRHVMLKRDMGQF